MILRTIIFQAYMWIELLLLMFVWLRVQWANKHYTREKRDALVDRIVRNWARRLLFMAGAKVTVKGRENIPEDRAVLYIANHNSIFDIVLFAGGTTAGRRVSLSAAGVATKEMFSRSILPVEV